jgi:predicted permease
MGLVKETIRRAGYLVCRTRFDSELDEEIRFHVETHAAELEQSGIARAEALAQAKREFGSAIRIREDTRWAWQFRWLDDLLADLRYAARALRHNPAFALTAIACLALGIGANTTIFSLSTEMLFSQPSSRDSQSLVKIWIGGSSASPMRDYRFIRDAGIFDGLAGENEETEVNWRQGDATDRLFTVRVTDNFFSVVGIPVAMGRPIEPGESDVVVLTHGFWQRRMGGDPNIIGRGMVLDGRQYVVTGVLPADHRTVTGFGFSPDLYLPVSDDKAIVTFYARLPGGMTRQIAYDRLVAACEELDRAYPHGNPRWANAVKVSAIYGLDRLKDDELMPIAAFFGLLIVVVGLVLLIACANVASLLLARSSGRRQELAIRLSIGAGRGRIIRQLSAESLLLALCGTTAGLGMNLTLGWLLSHVRFPLPIPLQLLIQPDWRLLAYSVGVVLVCTLATGLMPAIKGTRTGINAALKQDARQVGRARWTLRDALVVGQLAVSVVLLCTGFIFVRNLLRASTMTPGFDIDHTIWAYMRLVPEAYSKPDKTHTLAEAALDGLRALPGVEAAAIARNVPLNRHSTTGTGLRADVSPDQVFVMFNDNYVGPDYFKSMRIPIVRGREFVASDRAGSPPVAILNENMAERIFGRVNPVGHTIQFEEGPPVMIAGVAANSKYFTLGEENALGYYGPYAQLRRTETDLHFMIRAAGSPDGLVPTINRVLGQLDSTAAIETKPMRRALTFALLPSRVGAAILGSTGLLGLALAAIGLYGVLVYTVSRRIREIGLRVALGASPGNIVGLVLRQSLALVALGAGIGIALAVFAVRPLAAFLIPEVHTTDSTNFIVVAAVLVLVAIVATISPALRALSVDPGIALRHE